jgi:hypothetical protein
LHAPETAPGVNCVGFVSHNLALPMVTPTIATPALGGFFGYQSQLAASLQAAVSDWKAHNAGAAAADETPHERLVINVSLGWEPIYGGAVPAAGPAGLAPPVRAVYDALQHAACNGALVFAAAGNDPGGRRPPLVARCIPQHGSSAPPRPSHNAPPSKVQGTPRARRAPFILCPA